jgi:hypothetical protein
MTGRGDGFPKTSLAARLGEAGLIMLYALFFEAPGLAFAMLWLVGGDGISLRGSFYGVLGTSASLSVFLVAFIGLSRGPIDRWQRGLRLGLWAAFSFYLLLVAVFACMPALAEAWHGKLEMAAEDVVFLSWAIIANSFGLPFLMGAAGGALYGWLRGGKTGARQ